MTGQGQSQAVGVALELLCASRHFTLRLPRPDSRRDRLRKAIINATAALRGTAVEKPRIPAKPELEMTLRQILRDLNAMGLTNQEMAAIFNDYGWERK